MKARKAFLWKGTPQDVDQILKDCGRFDLLATVSKRMARIGLLFSSAYLTDVHVPERDVVRAEDVENGGFNFTDGCGGIGFELATMVYEALPVGERVSEPER
jgi:hypothetical protein